ncbi:GNAT family N-acetyltransferase [Chloroflexota bacterium]
MGYTVTRESFDSLASCWTDAGNGLNWSSVFILPAWLKTWWQEFGSRAELCLIAARQGEQIAGIAPLQVKEGEASFIGSVDVCDYLDFVVAPGREEDFFNAVLDDLNRKGITHLNLKALRPDSTVLTSLLDIARNRGYAIHCHQEDISVELDLPASWDEYLAILSKKQRHEVRRKLRRLWGAGNVEHHCVETGQETGDFMDTFLKLFSLSQEEKSGFMTTRMESFFRSLAKAMAEIGLLRLGILELDTHPAAMTMGFDYNKSHYLYNSSYDPRYDSLSVGLLCKVLCIKESIERGRKKWDFLKGDETYKYQLGGREVPLYNCLITIK